MKNKSRLNKQRDLAIKAARECDSKIQMETESIARFAIEYYQDGMGDYYKCNHCNKYHLTSLKRELKQKPRHKKGVKKFKYKKDER